MVNNSSSTPVFFKQACHANPGADKRWAGSSSYISVHLFLKFSNTSASNNASRSHDNQYLLQEVLRSHDNHLDF